MERKDKWSRTRFGAVVSTFPFAGSTKRFKASEKGKLWHTVCPKCKTQIDSWEHCVECYQIEAKEIKNAKQWLANIREITKKIKTATPAKYATSSIQHTQFMEKAENGESEKVE